MKPNNNEIASENARKVFESGGLKIIIQQSARAKDKLTQTQHAIREQQKQIEDLQIKVQKHVQQLVVLRLEERTLLKEQTLSELAKVRGELTEADKENGEREVGERKQKDILEQQMLAQQVLYEAEF
ncbi:hypothetical protein EAF04_008205 [Stromatinia cepivora]|nr:hypothetical protein EAF04_008205 [Stromatinia cepivora]